MSSLISIAMCSSFLVSWVKSNTCFFLAACDGEGLLVQKVIYVRGFVNYLLG